jgi:cysteine desulfurase/selenocysteine lyase
VHVEQIRADFPILGRKVHGKPLIYFDNAATTHKPVQVLEAIRAFYTTYNANIHRSPHTLGQEATKLYELAHSNIARFIGARSPEEIIFLRNTTEAINLVAYSLLSCGRGRLGLSPGDEVVLTIMEHHSNLVPWQQIRDRIGVVLRVVGIEEDGSLNLEQLRRAITSRTKLVTCTHVSNVLGTINPVREIAEMAHRTGALFLVDAAQSVPHMTVDVVEMGCDFLAFSGHKMLAPMGIGVLYGRREYLAEMRPFLYGGEMISDVSLETTSWNQLPWRFEAGTANVGGGIALGGGGELSTPQRLEGAIDYLERIGMEQVEAHEQDLTAHLLSGIRDMREIEVYGPTDMNRRAGIVSFNVVKEGRPVDAHLMAQLLDDEGIAVRSGGHCAYPLAQRMGVDGMVRASFYIYNTHEEVERFLVVMREIIAHRLL